MGNTSYVFYQPRPGAAEGHKTPSAEPHDPRLMHVARVEEGSAEKYAELWHGLTSSLTSSPSTSVRNSLEDLHHDCVQHYGGAIMPVYEEGEEPPSIATSEVEPIFDEMDASTEDASERSSIERPESQGQEGGRVEDDWFLITCQGDSQSSQEEPKLSVLRISIDGTKGSSATVRQSTLDKNHPHQELSRSMLGKLNFLGLFSGSKPQHNSDEFTFLKDKIEMLSSQVMQVEELRGHIAQVTAMLSQMHTSGISPSSDLAGLPFVAVAQHQRESIDTRASSPSLPLTTSAPPPPAPAPPPPPPPPAPGASSSSATVKRCAAPSPGPAKKELTMQDLEKHLSELIACADISSANVSRAVQAYMKCFGAHHKEALEALVQRYPFLVKKLPLKPKTAYQRMRVWEQHLFSTLDEKQATTWRRAKEFEIQKWETKEDILAEIDRIRVQIVEKERKEREEALKKEQKNIMASMMEELENTFKAAQRDQEKKQEEAELEQLEDEPLDLDLEDL